MAFQLLILVLYPTVIAPLFNKFSPLPAGDARERIERLLARCGFHASGLFVMDGSKRSGHGNAYFTGFGRAKRVVFFDTLLARLAPEEIEAVLAHELGHFRLRHVVKRIVWSAVLSIVFLGLLAWLAGAPWFYAGLGIPDADVAAAMARPGVALALFMLALPVFTFALSPVSAAYSRRHEFEADAFAAEHASAAALVAALIKLYEDNAATLTPDPIHSAFYDSHPPAALRVAASWGGGLSGLLAFAMQMCLVMLTGYIVAESPLFRRGLDALARVPNGPRAAVAWMGFVSMAMGLLNWGLSIVGSAVLTTVWSMATIITTRAIPETASNASRNPFMRCLVCHAHDEPWEFPLSLTRGRICRAHDVSAARHSHGGRPHARR